MASAEGYPDDRERDQDSSTRRRSRSRSRDRDRRRRSSREKDSDVDKKASRSKRRSKKSSRSRSRERSRSRSRSDSGRKKKPNSNWDQGPGVGPGGTPVADPYAAAMAHRMHHNPKKARTVFVGGVTPEMTADVIRNFFEHRLAHVPDRPKIPGPAVETVDVKMDKMYAFVEFHHAVDADIAMCMDGIRIGTGNQISVRRPSNYVPPPGQVEKKWNIQGVLSTQVPDGPHKIFLGNLPATMTEQEVQLLASAFGELSAFTLSKDRNTGLSKGYAFFCYMDPSVTNIACVGLNGQEIGGKRIACKPANQKTDLSNEPTAASIGGMMNPMMMNPMMGMNQMMGMGMMGMGMGMMGGMSGAAMGGMGMNPMAAMAPSSRCLIMDNMVTPEELADPEEYDDIMQDIRAELSNYGAVVQLAIPRPPQGNMDPQMRQQMMDDVGKIYVQYDTPRSAGAAFAKLNGRKFSERTIVMTFVPEQAFHAKGFR